MNIFDYAEYDNYGTQTVDVTVDVLADVLNMDRSRLLGLFGPGSLGTVTISPDDCMRWDDVEPCPEGSGQALLVDGRGQYRVDSVVDPDSQKILDFWDAHNRMVAEYGWPRGGYVATVLERYAGLLGLTYTTATFRGQSQGDWLEVAHVTDEPGKTWLLDEYRVYWDEGDYHVSVDLSDALGNTFEDSCGYLVGDEAVADCVADQLYWYFYKASAAARKAKNGV